MSPNLESGPFYQFAAAQRHGRYQRNTGRSPDAAGTAARDGPLLGAGNLRSLVTRVRLMPAKDVKAYLLSVSSTIHHDCRDYKEANERRKGDLPGDIDIHGVSSVFRQVPCSTPAS
jgi:hypothetical protein